jgi:hypothetical protein
VVAQPSNMPGANGAITPRRCHKLGDPRHHSTRVVSQRGPSHSNRVPAAVARPLPTATSFAIENLDDRSSGEGIAACSKLQLSGDSLSTEEDTARVVSVEREGERVQLPAGQALPDSVPGLRSAGLEPANSILGQRAALMEREEAGKRREWSTRLTVVTIARISAHARTSVTDTMDAGPVIAHASNASRASTAAPHA